MTCTPAVSRACTTPRTCSSVYWCCIACEPSRRVESVIRRSVSPPAVGRCARTSVSVTGSVTTGVSSGRMVMSPMAQTPAVTGAVAVVGTAASGVSPSAAEDFHVDSTPSRWETKRSPTRAAAEVMMSRLPA